MLKFIQIGLWLSDDHKKTKQGYGLLVFTANYQKILGVYFEMIVYLSNSFTKVKNLI